MNEKPDQAKNEASTVQALDLMAQDSDVSVVRSVAANRSTGAETLRFLATHQDIRVRVSVAWNPNTPFDVLAKLAGESDAGFAVNEGPLEPGWFDSIHGRLVWRMESNPEPELLDVLGKASATPNAYRDVDVVGAARRLRELHRVERVTGLDTAERIRYAKPRGRAGVARKCMAALAVDPEIGVRVAVAESFRATAAVRRISAADESVEVRSAVAGHPLTSEDLLIALWEKDGPGGDVAARVANNPATPSTLLRRIVDEAEELAVLMGAARHPALGASEQRTLMTSKQGAVQQTLAANQETLPELLELLSEDDRQNVRASVARNAAAPLSVSLALATDANVHVRLALAGRLGLKGRPKPPLPKVVCDILARDPELRVRERILKRYDLPWNKAEKAEHHKEMMSLRDSLRVTGHPDFPLSDSPRVGRLYGRMHVLTTGTFLCADEIHAMLAAHNVFLRDGGGAGKWTQMWVGPMVLATYLGATEVGGKQLSFVLKRIPRSIDLGEQDLRYSNLANCFCEEVDFSGSLLEGSVAVDGFWGRANFAGADLRRVDFSGSDLRGACFADADLRGADFECTDCTGADFRGAQLAGSRWPSAILDGIER